MIKYTPSNPVDFRMLFTPLERLITENRWVKLAELIPWDSLASVMLRV